MIVKDFVGASWVVCFDKGLGGAARYSFRGDPVPGRAARVNDAWGAQKVTADERRITFEFCDVDGDLRDSYTIGKPQARGINLLNLPMVRVP